MVAALVLVVIAGTVGVVAAITTGDGEQRSLPASATDAPEARIVNPTEGRTAHPADDFRVIDSRHLVVGAGCPSDLPAAHVVETRTKVRIRVVYAATANLCHNGVLVTLKSPLGKRRIVDATTGRTIKKLRVS